ncbi:MAG TPA: prepilin-type N-terminal cleavage/methylation domain-containing protein [Terriglobia bacterium]|nr:prepilin-type N-terminal cleavage/methylation domain-containing protein [Terriglobia bacterium]
MQKCSDRAIRRLAARAGAARQRGLTLAELIIAAAILLILSSAALPLARVQIRREQERELRLALRELRAAIDRYKEASDLGRIAVELGTEGYPKDLETLVEGVPLLNSPDGKKLRVLRRIPRDPMTNSTDWGLRSYQDEPDSTSWGGENVFDVYSKSTQRALDGSLYSDW